MKIELFKRLHGRKTPPGLELKILRKLPRVFVLASMIPIAMAVLVRVLPASPGVDRVKHIRTVDIFAIALEVTLLTAVFTVAVGAIIVYIMKGPGYVADAYAVSHADQRQPEHDDSEASGPRPDNTGS